MSSGFAGFVPPVKCSYSPVKCSYPPVECSYPPVKCSFAGGRWGSFLYRQTQDIERWRRCSRYILSPRKMFLLRFSCGKLGGGMVAPLRVCFPHSVPLGSSVWGLSSASSFLAILVAMAFSSMRAFRFWAVSICFAVALLIAIKVFAKSPASPTFR